MPVARKKSAKPKTTLRTEPVIRAECHQVPVTTLDIACSAVLPSPFQPRQEFPEAEIEQFAKSIAADGLLHPIAVRPCGAGYEMVDGERRLRACRLLQLDTIRAEVGEWTDAQVMRIVVASALQRRDLNAIEEGLAFRRAIAAGVAAGPTDLARQLGVSQGHVSNRIRLLELPDDWKQRVISGEIPPTHARSLVTYRDYPAILAAVADEAADDWSEIAGYHCTADEFEDRLRDIAYRESRPLSGNWHSEATHWRDVPVRKFSEEELAALKPIMIDVRSGRGHKEELRATNVDLWDKLQAEYLASRDADAEKKAAKKKPKTELSPAEKKAAAAEEKRKAKEREKQFAKRLYEWHLNWLRYLIAERLRRDATMQELLVIAMYATTVHIANNRISLTEDLKDACLAEAPDVTVDVKRSHLGSKIDVLGALVQVGEDQIEAVLGRTIAGWFWDEDGPNTVAYAEDLEPLATYLVIDRQAAWREDQAGPVSAAFWNLHSKDQLIAMAAELNVDLAGKVKKAEIVEAFMATNDLEVEPLAMPAEIRDIRKPK